ncbi:hypothetical protein ABW20_dc0107393 [Dactylellina cionopaga]|nr:hypothetical protein ABW20_dc0107393 [Dactylellina cionopaga]
MAAAFMNTPPATPAQTSIPPKSSTSATTSVDTPTSASTSASQMQAVSPSPAAATILGPMGNKPVACVRCKQKKIKCDGKTPSCSACVRAREQCLIPDMVTGRAYPRGYIEHLENRVSELQSIIDTRIRESKLSESRQASFSPFYINSPVTSDPFTPGKRSSATSIPYLPAELSLTLSPNEESLADLALARLLVQTLHLRDHGPCISKLSYLISTDSSTAAQATRATARLPPQNISSALLNLYIKNEHRCFPLLSLRELRATLGRVYAIAGDPEFQLPSPQDFFRTYMIFAIGSLSYTQSAHDPTAAGFSYYNSALHYVGKLPMMAGLAAVQNLLLLCIFSLNAKISQDAWRLSRRALHICIQDELHLSRTKKGDTSSQSEEHMQLSSLKQRVFWSSYALNRITSNLVYDRPPSIPEAEIDTEPGQQPLPETEQRIRSPMPETPNSPREAKYLLHHLTNLYHLSTVAFTSFNSNPPVGDITSKLKQYIEEFLDHNKRVLRNQNDNDQNENNGDGDDLPVYVKLSYGAHPMLIFQWAVTSMVALKDGIPRDVQTLALDYCAETITFISEAVASSPVYANSRLSFIITLRTLFVILSSLLAKTLPDSGVEIAGGGGGGREALDGAIVRAVEYLVAFGERFGHGNSYIKALVLALRFGIFERERRSMSEDGSSIGDASEVSRRNGKRRADEERMDIDGDGGDYGMQEVVARTRGMNRDDDNDDESNRNDDQPFLIANDDYSYLIPTLAESYPKLFALFESLQISSLPLNLDLTAIDAMPEVPHHAFKKFGSSAPDLEVLCKQVVWRLKVQYRVGYVEDQLHAFDARLGSNRPVEPWPQGGRVSCFNGVEYGERDGDGDGRGYGDHGDVAMDGMVSRGLYQPISEFVGSASGGGGMPKMDVDFSGFETNTAIYDNGVEL